MVSDEDLMRFHNGDTLESIPVVRLPQPRTPVPWRTVAGVMGVALLTGSVFGWSFGMGARAKKHPAAAPSVSTSPPAPTPEPSPVPTVTVTTETTVIATVPAPQAPVYASVEHVYVVQTPTTGGDPGTDYCLTYLGADSPSGVSALLLANAPAYQCQDFLFSTHPRDGAGVFEEGPPDCSATPGGRPALITTGTESWWGRGAMYTCLLLNDGA